MEAFLRDDIANFINNTESETYCNLSDDDIEDIVNNTIDSIMTDNDLNNAITSTIEWYVNHYIYNSDLSKKNSN